MSLTSLVDYIKEKLPSEAFAYIVGRNLDERKFKVVSDEFIISTCERDGFVRVVRDIRMEADPQIRGEVNSCRALYLYETIRNEIFHNRTKYVFE